MSNTTLAEIIDATHLLYVLTVIVGLVLVLLGGALGWRWVRNPWIRLVHLSMMLIVAIEAIFDITCPMTDWSDAARGREIGEESFIGRCVRAVLFPGENAANPVPSWVFTASYLTFAALIIASFFLVPPRRSMSLTTMAAIPHLLVGIAFVSLIRGPVGMPFGILALIDGAVLWWLGRDASSHPKERT
jgi:hypothetical protein